MSMISVFIDTSALYTFGAAFDRLQYLVSLDVVKVYLSHVVVREWASHLEASLRKSIEVSKSKVNDVIKDPCLSEIDRPELLNEVFDYLGELLPRASEISQSKMEGLLAQLQAQILPYENAQGTAIIDSYFNGFPPFRSKKSREDFPDAFILENAKDAIKEVGVPLHCIVADGPLKNALSSIEGIILHNSLRDFVQSEEVHRLASEKEQERTWAAIFERIQGFLSGAAKEVKGSLERLLLDKMPGEKIEHYQIPDDNNEAYISEIYEPENIELDWEAAESYGNGIVIIPFKCTVKVGIGFSVFRADAYEVPDEIWVDFQDPETHHYFDAGGEVMLDVSGTLEVRFTIEEPNDGELPEITDICINVIDDISILEESDGKIFI